MSSRADRLLGLGRWAEARTAFEEQLAERPDDVDVRIGYGLALLGSGDAAGALAELSWVLDRLPEQADARYNRANALSSLGRVEEAVLDLDVLIGRDPEVWYLRSDRGAAFLKLKRVADAVAELRRAEALAPGEAAVWLNLGSALLAAGDFQEAHQFLRRAAEARVPGGVTALRRVRQQLFREAAGAGRLGEAAGRVFDAQSTSELTEIADDMPFVLSDAFFGVMENLISEHPEHIGGGSRSRIAELQRLSSGTEEAGRQRTTDQASFERQVDKQHLLYRSGAKAEAAAMAPALAEMALRAFGPDSPQYGVQLATQAVFEVRRDLLDKALGILARTTPAQIPAAVANYATTISDPDDRAGLLRTVVPQLADAEQEDAARVCSMLAQTLRNSGQVAEAEALVRQALDDREFTGTVLAEMLLALSETVFAQEKDAEAAKLCERAVDLYREAYGDSHQTTAQTMRGLGRINARIGRVEQAERWLLRAAAAWKRLKLPMELALTEADLALMYGAAGAASACRQMAAQTLSTLDPLCGQGDGNEPYVLHVLRDAYRRLQDFNGELAIQLRLVELQPVAAELNNLGEVYYRSDRFEEAAQWYEAALQKATPDTVFFARHNLANALNSLGRADEAIAEHLRTLTEMRAMLLADDPGFLHALVDVAGVLARAGRAAEAADLIAEAAPYLDGKVRLQEEAADVAASIGIEAPGLLAPGEQFRLLIEDARQASGRGDYPDAERQITAAIEIATKLHGPRNLDVASLKLFLAAVRRDGGSGSGVEELIREALALQQEFLDPDDPVLDATRLELGLALEGGKDEEAVPLLTAGARMAEGLQLGRALTALGLIAQRRGEFTEAERYLRQALDLAEDLDNQLAARRNLVMLLIEMRRLEDATGLAEETILLVAGWPEKSDARTGQALLIYAKVAGERQHYADSEKFARAAWARLENLDTAGSYVADAANELGLALLHQRRSAHAEEWFKRSARGMKASQPQRLAAVLMNRAHGYETLGDLDAATKLTTDALSLIESTFGRESALYGAALGRLGHLELAQWKMTAAATLTKAVQIIEASAGENLSLAQALSDLANLYLTIGGRKTAEALAERSLAITQALYGPDTPDQAIVLALLARCKAFAGEQTVAEALFRAALDLQPSDSEIWRAFGHFLAATGQSESARAALNQLGQLDDVMVREMSTAAVAERRRRALFARLWKTVDAYLTLSGAEDARAAWELIVRRLGQDAHFMSAERTNALRSSGAGLLRELGILRAQLARAVISGEPAEVERLRDRRDEQENLLARHLPADPEVPTPELIAAAMPADTTLITYVRFDSVDFAHDALGEMPQDLEGIRLPSRQRYLAFVTSADQLRLIDLGPAQDIEANISKTIEWLPRAGDGQPYTFDRFASTLRERLIDPLGPLNHHVQIVAGGNLGLLPFQLLPFPDGKRMVDRHTISYLSAPRDLLRRAGSATTYRRPGPPLVIADPDYGLGAENPKRYLAPLPAAAEEGEHIAALLGTKAITGPDAVTTTLTVARSPIVIHLATHGIYLPGPELASSGDYYERV